MTTRKFLIAAISVSIFGINSPVLANHCEKIYQQAESCVRKNGKLSCREEGKELKLCLGNSGHYHYKSSGEMICLGGIC